MKAKRKIKFLMTGILSMMCFGLWAQDAISLRHIKGIRAIDFTGGIGKNCFNGEITYVQFLSDVFHIRLGANFEKTTFPSVILYDYSLKAGMNYTLFKLGENVFVNTELGGFMGMENNTEYKPSDDITFIYPASGVFIYGGFIGANLEIYMNSNVCLFGSIQQHYIQGCDFGNRKYQANGGFRFILN